MKPILFLAAACYLGVGAGRGANFTPAPQSFRQEVGSRFAKTNGSPSGPMQLLDLGPDGSVRTFGGGQWYELRDAQWQAKPALSSATDSTFVFAGTDGEPVTAPIPWREARQLLRAGSSNIVASASQCWSVTADGRATSLGWPGAERLNQLARSPEGRLCAAASGGLYALTTAGWTRLDIEDHQGRSWGTQEVLGVAFNSQGSLWFAVKAGVGARSDQFGWRFFEGKDGLPVNDFTGLAAGPDGEVWFTTHLGVVRYDGDGWHYRQGPRWLPHDDVAQGVVDGSGGAWFATAGGIGRIERRPMTLAAKAEFYEQEIERYIKRTPFGFVAEAALRRPGDKASADPQDSDNDGLWTSMYGAGECFAYAATRDPKAKARAKQAFEALRGLQKVTQGGEHEPPRGYVARTIRPVEWPDPNAGRLEFDRQARQRDRLWKVYEPRWPQSADGRWFWKSDTSSDELDGHYFFYPLYFDFCADTEPERERVREVVRDLTDHLLTHEFSLVDHDGKPTRWGVYGPDQLNHDPFWWQERGLKSLSLLSYLAVAEHLTGDAKYARASRELIDRHGYAHNAMYPKVQQGPGSGNQSDDEMAFMSYYSLLRCSPDEDLKRLIRYSFFRYWVNEWPEMNPFFNFAYAGQNLATAVPSAWGPVPLSPWWGWHEDAMATLYGFPLDRVNWPHRNRQRLDLEYLPPERSEDLSSPDDRHSRGYRVNGKVLPVENRYFGHWNTDPWQLDYTGNGRELGAGTVFLLPYYMGLFHGFIEKPGA